MEFIRKYCGSNSKSEVKVEEVTTIAALNGLLHSFNKSSAAGHLHRFSVEDLNAGVKSLKKGIELPIFCAVGSDEESFDKMVEMGVNVHAVDSDGDTLFMKAVKNGHYNWLDKVAKLGIDINKPNNMGDYPVHAAARRMFHREYIYKLIELGADFTVRNPNGKTVRDLLKEELRMTRRNLTKFDFRQMYPNASREELKTNIYDELKDIISVLKDVEIKNTLSKVKRNLGIKI